VSIPDPATLNQKIASLAESWLSCFTDLKPLTRLRVIKRIATSTDAEWVAEREAVVAALDNPTAASALRAQVSALQTQLANESAARIQLQSELDDALAKIAAAKAALA